MAVPCPPSPPSLLVLESKWKQGEGWVYARWWKRRPQMGHRRAEERLRWENISEIGIEYTGNRYCRVGECNMYWAVWRREGKKKLKVLIDLLSILWWEFVLVYTTSVRHTRYHYFWSPPPRPIIPVLPFYHFWHSFSPPSLSHSWFLYSRPY